MPFVCLTITSLTLPMVRRCNALCPWLLRYLTFPMACRCKVLDLKQSQHAFNFLTFMSDYPTLSIAPGTLVQCSYHCLCYWHPESMFFTSDYYIFNSDRDEKRPLYRNLTPSPLNVKFWQHLDEAGRVWYDIKLLTYDQSSPFILTYHECFHFGMFHLTEFH